MLERTKESHDSDSAASYAMGKDAFKEEACTRAGAWRRNQKYSIKRGEKRKAEEDIGNHD